MTRSAATREMGSALSAIKEADTTNFETAVYGLLAELHGFIQLKEEHVASLILDRRWSHVVTRAQALVQDWDYLRGVTPEQLQMAHDTVRQDAEKYELLHGHPADQWPTPDYEPRYQAFPGS